MTKEFRKEHCLERLAALVELLKKAETFDDRLYFVTKAEGFLDGIFFADIIDNKEYSEWGEAITELLILD